MPCAVRRRRGIARKLVTPPVEGCIASDFRSYPVRVAAGIVASATHIGSQRTPRHGDLARCGCHRNTGQRKDGWGHIGNKSRTWQLEAWCNAGARDDEGYAQPALRCVEFVELAGRGQRRCPLAPDIAKAAFLAHVFEAPVIAMQHHPKVHAGCMDGIAGLWSVVRRNDEHGVVELPRRFQMRDQPADVMVHRLQHAGINLHAARGHPLVFGR